MLNATHTNCVHKQAKKTTDCWKALNNLNIILLKLKQENKGLNS